MGFMRTKHDICWEMSSEWELKDDFVKSIYNVLYSWKGGVAPPEVGSTQPSNHSLQYRDMQAGTTCKHLTHSTPTREGFAVSQHIPCSPPKNQCVHHPEVSPGSSKCHSPPCPTPLYFFAVCHIKKKKKVLNFRVWMVLPFFFWSAFLLRKTDRRGEFQNIFRCEFCLDEWNN